MSYVDEHLNAGERVTFRTKIHPIVFVGPTSLALLALFCATQREIREYAVYMLLLTLIVGVYVAVQIATSEFAVTTSRVIIKVGWLSRRTVELQLAKVEGITVEQDPFGRIFDYGTIVVGGTGGTKEPFKWIRAPIVFRKQVQEQIDSMSVRQASPSTVGVVNIMAETRQERECPYCAERILARATMCRFCGKDVQPAAAS